MSLPQTVAKVLRNELACYTAWPPVGTPLGLGDYGILDDGLFNKSGNVSEIPVAFKSENGNDLRLNFTSSDATIVRATAKGVVTVFPEGDINASFSVNFNSANAVMLKAAKITVKGIANIAQIAKVLKHSADWSRSNVVVGTILIAERPLLIGTRSAGTEVSFGGSTGALKALELGSLDANLSFAKNKELGLEVVGTSGVIGVRLFKVRLVGERPKFMGPGAPPPEAEQEDYEWV